MMGPCISGLRTWLGPAARVAGAFPSLIIPIAVGIFGKFGPHLECGRLVIFYLSIMTPVAAGRC